MDILKEVLSTILSLVGLFTLFYFGAYFIELGKVKLRRKLYVCDFCNKKITQYQSVDDKVKE